MLMAKMLRIAFSFAALAMMTSAASAQPQSPPASSSGAGQYDPLHPVSPAAPGSVSVLPDMPPVQTQGDITYVSGGFGAGERQALQSAAPQFNLHLLFAGPGGEYLANVKLRITEQQGGNIVLETVANGPYFLAKLHPGRYNISADDGDGHPQMRAVAVPERGAASASFFWRKAPS
jgi:hypothetical protein